MRVWVLIAAILLGILGLLFTETLIGAIVGVPMLLFGFILFLYGLFAKEKRVTSVSVQAKRNGEATGSVGYSGPESALDSDEKAVLGDDCTFRALGDIKREGTLFLTDQNWLEFVISENKGYVRDHYYNLNSVRDVRVESTRSKSSLVIDWMYDTDNEELTYVYDSLNDPEEWKRKILEAKHAAAKSVRPQSKRKITSKRTGQFCIACGSALPIGSKYCNKCGVQQP